MKSLKEKLLKKSMKMVGSLSLFFAAMVLVSTSLIGGHQPKCPDDLLK
ncbi:cyclic lactone autoinducer peptide [Clostridium kluyveri]|nr:cyclic lactone autoinducer peptide [Clostridium kluyveri]